MNTPCRTIPSTNAMSAYKSKVDFSGIYAHVKATDNCLHKIIENFPIKKATEFNTIGISLVDDSKSCGIKKSRWCTAQLDFASSI